MSICPQCQQRVSIWRRSIWRGVCPTCRKKAIPEKSAAQIWFESADRWGRVAIGAKRGALLGVLGLLLLGFTVLVMVNGEGSQYPFGKLSVRWLLVSLAVAGVAIFLGWLYGWAFGIAALISMGGIGGAIVGASQGYRGRWDIFGA